MAPADPEAATTHRYLRGHCCASGPEVGWNCVVLHPEPRAVGFQSGYLQVQRYVQPRAARQWAAVATFSRLDTLGFGGELYAYATQGTADFLRTNCVRATILCWPLENRSPNAIEFLGQKKLDLVIDIPKNYQNEELTNDYLLRRRALDASMPLITNIQLAQRFVEAIGRKRLEDLQVKSWREYEPLHSTLASR